jgi:uncharacterized protein
MLLQTFCHLPGIGYVTEKKLWQAGITSWDTWQHPSPVKMPNTITREVPALLESSLDALENENPSYFTDHLRSADHWRLFPHFRSKTAYLDIETTGMAQDADITTIALWDGHTLRHYVNGINIDEFADDIQEYAVLVSYNGRSFDIPYLESFFRIRLEQAQIDLRYVLAKLGFKGGLKGCEKQMGISRGELDGFDGSLAVILWNEYERYNNQKALETLLAYNIEDTVNLEYLLVEAYNRNVLSTPFYEDLVLQQPPLPDIPFKADIDLLDTIRSNYHRY